MRPTLLEIDDLHVEFPVYNGRLKVIDGVSLTARAGERLGLVGESGCGKTTCGRCVVRLVKPSAGKIWFSSKRAGKTVDLVRPGKEEWKQVQTEMQMIFQNPNAALNPVFTIGTQFKTALQYVHPERIQKAENLAITALQEVQLPDARRILKSYPFQLSGGMCQRVCIAMALASEPELLIADEPTTALDVTVQNQILQLLHALVKEKGTSVIFITHNLGVIREIAHLVHIMYAGTVVESGPPRELFSNPLHPYTQGLMNAVPKLTAEAMSRGIPGSIPDYSEPPTGCRFHPRCTERLPICEQTRPPFFRASEDHTVACFLYQEGGKDFQYAARR